MRKIIKGNRKNIEYVTDFIKLKTIFSKTQAMKLSFEMLFNPAYKKYILNIRTQKGTCKN